MVQGINNTTTITITITTTTKNQNKSRRRRNIIAGTINDESQTTSVVAMN